MSQDRSPVIFSFSNDLIISIEMSNQQTININSRLEEELEELNDSDRLYFWSFGEETSPIMHKLPGKHYIPELLMILRCARAERAFINETQIRYVSYDDNSTIVCGTFAIEEGGATVSHIKIYCDGIIKVKKYNTDLRLPNK